MSEAPFDYSSIEKTAHKLIEKFGQLGAIRRVTAGSGPDYDPGEPSEAFYAIRLVDLDFVMKNENGTLVRSTTRTVLISPRVPIEPTEGDEICLRGVFSGVSYTGGLRTEIDSLTQLAPSGTTLLWTAECLS